MGWCDAAKHEAQLLLHPEVDYFTLTACPEAFYSSYSTAITLTLPISTFYS